MEMISERRVELISDKQILEGVIMRTEELLRGLASRKLVINGELIEEIVKRQDARS